MPQWSHAVWAVRVSAVRLTVRFDELGGKIFIQEQVN